MIPIASAGAVVAACGGFKETVDQSHSRIFSGYDSRAFINAAASCAWSSGDGSPFGAGRGSVSLAGGDSVDDVVGIGRCLSAPVSDILLSCCHKDTHSVLVTCKMTSVYISGSQVIEAGSSADLLIVRPTCHRQLEHYPSPPCS
jgi:hypothetical protein